MEQDQPRGKSIQAVDRALEIINLLADNPRGLGVSTIAERAGIHISTAHRLLATLMLHNLVRQERPGGKYRLGLRLIDLGTTVLSGLDLRDEATPFLEELQRATGEVVHLAILDDSQVVYIAKVESEKRFQIYSRIGRRSPAHCTGLGKAILAFSPESIVDKVIEGGLRKFTSTTICDPDSLKSHLQEIRSQGYCFDLEEHEKGVLCVAAPILNHAGLAVGAISVTGLSVTLSRERLGEIAPLVRTTANSISARFNFQERTTS